MNKGVAITLGLIGLATILPIWRGAGHSRQDGISAWRLIYESSHDLPNSPFGHPHLPYDEAVAQARAAYQEHCNG